MNRAFKWLAVTLLAFGFVACGDTSDSKSIVVEALDSVDDICSSSVIPSSSSVISSSSSAIPSEVEGSSSSVESSSAVSSSSAQSSSSTEPSSSSVISSSSSNVIQSSSSDVIPDPDRGSSSSSAQAIPYTTECPAGETCTYAPTKYLNPNITYGELLDTRDYQVYKTVTIGTQTWLAQNLNYNYDKGTGKSYCYESKADSCAKYGRLYTWAAAMDACPSEWHLPSVAEWETLFKTVDKTYTDKANSVGTVLKSTSGWMGKKNGPEGNGDDTYGFSALPAGNSYGEVSFKSVGYYANFWTDTKDEYSEGIAYYVYFLYNSEEAILYYLSMKDGYSVRCLKN